VRPVLVRSLAVLGIGLVALIAILYYASTVDGRPPRVERIGLTQHQPADEHVALTTTTVEVEFSEAVQEPTAQGAFRIDPQVAGEYAWSGTTMTFTPGARLPLDTQFRVWVAAGVRDLAGNRMAEDAPAFAFATVGPPAVTGTDPQDGAQEVSLEGPIVITFSVLMDTASVEQSLRVSPGADLEATWDAERLTLTPTGQLAEGARYTITIGSGARDSTGEPLADAYRFSFRTTRSPLSPSLLMPADDADGVAVTTPLAIFFDREIDPDTLPSGSLTIEPAVPGDLELVAAPGAAGLRDGTRRIVRFLPSAPLQPSTTYQVTFDASLAGTDGAQLPGPIAWSFTTGAPLSTLGNQVVFLSDRAGISNLWAMNPDGSAQRQLSAELSPVTSYAVAPDGRSYVVGDGAVLVLQEANGSAREVLTPPELLEYDPAWAPDSSRFAFGRSDRASGEGLGIWLRDADGGNQRQVELPPELFGGASPRPSSEAGARLREPRFSPDGAGLAFIDMTGRVGVVELVGGRLTTASIVAIGAPVWLRDSTGVLLTAVDGNPLAQPEPGQPLPDLGPETPLLAGSQLATLHIARLDRGAQATERLDLPDGASRPAVGRDQLAFVVGDPSDASAGGELWLSLDAIDAAADRLLLDDGGPGVASASFGIDTRSLLVGRSGGGIWVVDTITGDGEELAADGWLPHWLP